MGIKNLFMNILLGKKASSQRYIEHLRKLGAQVGERTVFLHLIKFQLMISIHG